MKKKLIFLLSLWGLFGVGIPNAIAATTIDKHSTMDHTKLEVIDQYLNSRATFNYNNSIYTQEPVKTSPYFEGALKEEVKNDVLRRLNFYRWLYGINPVAINESRMARSQKAALIQAVNNDMTHFPTKPADMSEEFYQEAYAGASADIDGDYIYSGNCALGYRIDDAIDGWVDDLCTTCPEIYDPGHRFSMLDPSAVLVSFGSVTGTKLYYGSYSPYSAASIYYSVDALDRPQLNDEFYAWPSAGYFPVETYLANEKSTWSVWTRNGYNIHDDTTVTFTYLGKDYVIGANDIHKSEFDSRAIYYYLPTELSEQLIDSEQQYRANTSVDVKISNLSDYGTDVNIEYTTNFINAKKVSLKSIDLCLKKDGTGSCNKISNNYEFDLSKTYNADLLLSPTDATTDHVTISVDDESILTYDASNKVFIPKKAGTTTINISENYNHYSKKINVRVGIPSTGIKLNKETTTILLDDTEKLVASLVPDNSTDNVSYTWVSSDNNIINVDENGVVTAKKVGNATVTVTSSNGYSATCNVAVEDYMKGDLNKDGKVTLSDVITNLKVYLELEDKTDHVSKAGDMNNDGKITLADIIAILKLYLEIE